MNCAVTFFGLSAIKTHVLEVPNALQSPPHPLKRQYELLGVAIRVMEELSGNEFEQTPVQLFIPAGLLETVPPEVITLTVISAVALFLLAVHEAFDPPFRPRHCQFVELPEAGNAGDAGDVVPSLQNVSVP